VDRALLAQAGGRLERLLDRQERVRRRHHRLGLEPAVGLVRPASVGALAAGERSDELLPPVVRRALEVGDAVLLRDAERPRERVVVVVETLRPEAGVLLEGPSAGRSSGALPAARRA
jgi:hypothetical protein